MGRLARLWLMTLTAIMSAHTALAKGNFYFSGAAGTANASVDAGTAGGRYKRITGHDTGLRVGVGYRFPRFLAIEANYQDFGQISGDRNTCAVAVCTTQAFPVEAVDASAFAVSAVASFRISERLSGYGRLGVADWRFSSASGIFSDSGRDAQVGGGFRWSFNEPWAMFIDYTKTKIDVRDVAIGVQFRLKR